MLTYYYNNKHKHKHTKNQFSKQYTDKQWIKVLIDTYTSKNNTTQNSTNNVYYKCKKIVEPIGVLISP